MITLKGIIDEDFVNYRVPSMTLMFPYCDFKCEKDEESFCQNSSLAKMPNIEVPVEKLYERYINNPITKSIVLQGLEPMDSWKDVNLIMRYFRQHECYDDIVIYTGYYKNQVLGYINHIKSCYSNIIVKFGRFISGDEPHFDPVLGVNLASNNQYAERITK